MINPMLRPTCIVSVRSPCTSRSSAKRNLTFCFFFPSDIGRTGRFGRKGISINFVHNQRTWTQMDQIEKALGRKIIRIETNDLDEMEQVSFFVFFFSWECAWLIGDL